ncbi:MAG: hypothetical protein J2P52_02940 [Blastocatellia bacterium]|nr:hypothetical protein [Blastocatellia bacterium]
MNEENQDQRSYVELTEKPCAVCGEGTLLYWYCVDDRVWKEAGFSHNDAAHATCLASRLGRLLVKGDFLDVPANDIALAIFGDSENRVRTYKEHLESQRANLINSSKRPDY